MNDNLKRYISDVKKHIVTDRKVKKACISELSGSVSAYIGEKPDADYSELCAKFGTPQEIAEAFSAQDCESTRPARKKLALRNAIIAVLCAAIIAVGGFSGYKINNSVTLGSLNYIEDEITVNSETPLSLLSSSLQIYTDADGKLSILDGMKVKNATKNFSFSDKKSNIICRGSLTCEFTNDDNFKNLKEPEINLTCTNDDYSAQVKNIMSSARGVTVSIIIEYKGNKTEKTVEFGMDSDGNLY